MNVEVDHSKKLKWLCFFFYGLCLINITPLYLFNYMSYPEALWFPTGLLQLRTQSLIEFSYLSAPLAYAWQGLAVLCAFQIFFKFTSVLFFILSLFMFNVADSYGYQTHTYMPLVLVSMALAFGGKHKIFLSRFIFCIVFFSAGLSKVRNGGLDWIFSESMQNILLRSQLIYHDIHQQAGALNWHTLVAKNLLLTQVLASLTIIIELSAPLALVYKRLRLPIVASLFFMQVGIYFLILVNFKAYMALYLFWWDQHPRPSQNKTP